MIKTRTIAFFAYARFADVQHTTHSHMFSWDFAAIPG